MSENESEETTVSGLQGSGPKGEGQQTGVKASAPAAATEPGASESSGELSELMSSGDSPAKSVDARPDLDAEAMRAAQAAIAQGERALATARARLGADPKPARRGSKGRELALRLLLAGNVLAMIIVVMVPFGSTGESSPATGPVTDPATEPPVVPKPQPTPSGPRLADKYNQALLASENREYAKAVTLLEEYLVESPNMQASRKVNVYRAIAHYSSMIGRFRMAQDYERRAQAETQSHSLPEDLVAMAMAAAENNDQESLRQIWARFLLQQRQIPSSLYQHVAEAYLQLGDSYRIQANEAAERARLEELQRADELLRDQGKTRGQGR